MMVIGITFYFICSLPHHMKYSDKILSNVKSWVSYLELHNSFSYLFQNLNCFIIKRFENTLRSKVTVLVLYCFYIVSCSFNGRSL